MVDHNVTGAARHFDAEEAAAENACARAATAHGLTAEQAEQCDDGDQRCPTCPWRKDAAAVDGVSPGLQVTRLAVKVQEALQAEGVNLDPAALRRVAAALGAQEEVPRG